jgi:hypothetical protein
MAEHRMSARRNYVFRRREDRRRIAVRRGAGMSPVDIAAIERTTPERIERLLSDESMAALVTHYGALQAMNADERLRRLSSLALEMLELAVEVGDLRAAAFVVAATSAGRHPADLLAAAICRSMDKMRTRTGSSPRSDHPRAARADDDDASAGALPGIALDAKPRQGRGEWGWWAGTCATPELAEHVGLRAYADVRSSLAGTLRRLRDRVRLEAERLGATSPSSAALLIRATARQAQARPQEGLALARSLQSWRRAAARGQAGLGGQAGGTGPPCT